MSFAETNAATKAARLAYDAAAVQVSSGPAHASQPVPTIAMYVAHTTAESE